MLGFIFLFLIPGIAGFVTAANGASYFKPDELHLALMINVPICLISNITYWALKD